MGRKQIPLNFNENDPQDMKKYKFITDNSTNSSRFIKDIITFYMMEQEKHEIIHKSYELMKMTGGGEIKAPIPNFSDNKHESNRAGNKTKKTEPRMKKRGNARSIPLS